MRSDGTGFRFGCVAIFADVASHSTNVELTSAKVACKKIGGLAVVRNAAVGQFAQDNWVCSFIWKWEVLT